LPGIAPIAARRERIRPADGLNGISPTNRAPVLQYRNAGAAGPELNNP
jgi:hypothetical protein